MRIRGAGNRVDANQRAIVVALRKIGCSVAILSPVGDGVPDLLVGFRGKTFLLEVKDYTQPPSKRRLTPDEQLFFDTWNGGELRIVDSPISAVNAVTLPTA